MQLIADSFYLPQEKQDKLLNALEEVKKEIHYFRNELNYEPPTLLDLLKERDKYGWDIMLLDGTVYHMEGEQGGFNLKWMTPAGSWGMSGDRIFEAVYGLGGTLLQGKDQGSPGYEPDNMGTYNYGYSYGKHTELDIQPYLQYGNIPGVPATYQSDLEAWNANNWKAWAWIPWNYRLAIEDHDYSWTIDRNGAISKPRGAVPSRSFFYILLGDDNNNYFKLTSELIEVTDFAIGGKGDDIYEMQPGSKSIICDIGGSNTLRFDFEIKGKIDSAPIYDGNKGTGKYLMIEENGSGDVDFFVVEYVLGVWWFTNKICTLLNGTAYTNLQCRNGLNWANIS
jgi:hypothetical protein